MKLLLDTHTFLWLNDQPEKLGKAAMRECENPDNTLCLSIVSLWEIQIKKQLSKLDLKVPWWEMLHTQERENALTTLAVSVDHVQRLGELPMFHRDPFDRMLVVQAQVEGMTLVSADQSMAPYDVHVLW